MAPLPEQNGRLLFFAAVILVALASGFKSSLVSPGQVWALSALLLVVAIPAVFKYLHTDAGAPPVEHYVPAAMGAVVVAGLAVIIPEWWKYVLAVVAFGVGFYAATVLDRARLRDRLKPGHLIVQEVVLGLSLAGGYLVVLTQLQQPSQRILQLGWLLVLTVLASYRAFRVLGTKQMSPRRAFFFAAMVAQVVLFLAGALAFYASVSYGAEAVMLFLAWYINRGLIQHTIEETMSRQIFLEYGAFGAVLAYLFYASYHPS